MRVEHRVRLPGACERTLWCVQQGSWCCSFAFDCPPEHIGAGLRPLLFPPVGYPCSSCYQETEVTPPGGRCCKDLSVRRWSDREAPHETVGAICSAERLVHFMGTGCLAAANQGAAERRAPGGDDVAGVGTRVGGDLVVNRADESRAFLLGHPVRCGDGARVPGFEFGCGDLQRHDMVGVVCSDDSREEWGWLTCSYVVGDEYVSASTPVLGRHLHRPHHPFAPVSVVREDDCHARGPQRDGRRTKRHV